MPTPYQTRLFEANRAAMHRDTAGNPLPAGQRRHLSKAESYAIGESVRQRAIAESHARQRGGGFSETAPASRAPIPGTVAEQHPKWLESDFVDGIVAEVATRTAAVAKLETDPGRLSEMDSTAFADHVGKVTEAVESMGAPLPPARINDTKQLSEMSDAEFRAYSERLLSGPQRLTPPPNRRVNEAMDLAKLTEVAGSTPATAEESFDVTRVAYEGVGRRLKSPFWR